MNVFSFLQQSAHRFPNNVYVVDKGTNYTYSEIHSRSIALAAMMNSPNLHGGDRVLIYLDNSAEYIIAFFAALLINCIVVPVNKNLSGDTISFIIADSAPKYIITNSIFLGRLENSQIDFGTTQIINIDQHVEPEIHLGQDLTASLSVDGDLPALILYTSGTTRMPKGVVLTHMNLTANTESINEYLGLTDEDSLLAVVNFAYSYGNSTMLTHTKAGGKIIIENRAPYPAKVAEHLYSSQATGFSTVGSYLRILLEQQALKPFHLQYLRYITFAGESTSFDDIVLLKKMAPHINVYVMYGQTEASARLSYLEPEMLFSKPGSAGKGMPGVILRVVREDGSETSPGEIGEVIAYGKSIMKGYWNNETATQAALSHGWLYTGDMAVKDEDGYLFIKGRKDDVIKHLGHRISPAEIEEAVNSSDQVLESAVIGVNNTIKAFVVPKGCDASISEIQAHVRKLLPAFKRPQIIELIDELPRTANGKIKRSALRTE